MGFQINKYFIFLVLLLLSSSVKISYASPLEENAVTFPLEPEALHFWRANPNYFNITSCKIFPMASFGENGIITNLGKAWITWILDFNGSKVPAYAVFDRGTIKDFRIILNYYEEIHFQAGKDILVMITSTNDTTSMTLHIYGKNPLESKLDFNSTQHQVFFSTQNFHAFMLANGTVPMNVFIVGYSLVIEETEIMLQSSFPGSGLYRTVNDTFILVNGGQTHLIPLNISRQAVLGHILLQPAIYDLDNDYVFWNNQIIPLPADTVEIYKFGMKSSILRTKNNLYYEFNQIGWELLDHYSQGSKYLDYAVIDIGLYFSAYTDKGLRISQFGLDEDHDNSPDAMESYYGSYPYKIDSDDDGIPDQLEIAYGLKPLENDRDRDYDGDYMSTIDELLLGLDPQLGDTDYGGALDGWEVNYDFNPFNATDDQLDNDNDGVVNSLESIWNSSPFSQDTDGDKLPDSWEIQYEMDPNDSTNAMEDSDGDDWSNLEEYQRGTDPLFPDQKKIFSGLGIPIVILVIIAIPTTILLKRKINF